MGFAVCMGYCFGCKRTFTFNPNKVPSIRDPNTGSKEPVCENCVKKANPLRIANGLEPIRVLPGAYDMCEEEEL